MGYDGIVHVELVVAGAAAGADAAGVFQRVLPPPNPNGLNFCRRLAVCPMFAKDRNSFSTTGVDAGVGSGDGTDAYVGSREAESVAGEPMAPYTTAPSAVSHAPGPSCNGAAAAA